MTCDFFVLPLCAEKTPPRGVYCDSGAATVDSGVRLGIFGQKSGAGPQKSGDLAADFWDLALDFSDLAPDFWDLVPDLWRKIRNLRITRSPIHCGGSGGREVRIFAKHDLCFFRAPPLR